jgi:hypothetical protein
LHKDKRFYDEKIHYKGNFILDGQMKETKASIAHQREKLSGTFTLHGYSSATSAKKHLVEATKQA